MTRSGCQNPPRVLDAVQYIRDACPSLPKDMTSTLLEQIYRSSISFIRQVPIDRDGRITASRQRAVAVIDFVVGETPSLGDDIRGLVVLSVNRSCRERWLQDGWTLVHRPRLYLLYTLSTDYPDPSTRFLEDAGRKTLTSNPKKRDRRVFRLGPRDLVDELRAALGAETR